MREYVGHLIHKIAPQLSPIATYLNVKTPLQLINAQAVKPSTEIVA